MKREWFFEQRDGNCRLMASLAVRLAETAPTWGRAVAPFAEWVAQTLRTPHRKPANKDQTVPTRLTQRRRSEGRGKSIRSALIAAPRLMKICEVCGAEKSAESLLRYLRDEVVERSSWQFGPCTVMHKSERSEKGPHRKRKSAMPQLDSGLDPSGSVPDWMNEEYYLSEDSAQLGTSPFRQIAIALRIRSHTLATHPCGPTPPASEALAGAGGIGGCFES